ncbi:MAG: DEAD/DEAH box helicase [Promethearchaeota archaeon]|nr:MAG: DEAD/DEAH box helicase [Candidatus Lokiarchaeota archaeon]
MEQDCELYFNGSLLKENKIKYRRYQKNIFIRCKNRNSLVVLPTGLGKTIIAILLAAYRLKQYNSLCKILLLAPTRPLVSQHYNTFKRFLNIKEDSIIFLTGRVSPEKRLVSFQNSDIIISTPQVIKNDVMRGRYDLKDVGLIIFDEAHRTKGNYAYTFISEEYMRCCTDPLILGITASPGKNLENIQEVCDNLSIENIILRSIHDKDVKDYVYDIDTFLERVELPINYLEISKIWEELFNKYLRFFIDRELINPYKRYFSKLDFLGISRDLSLSLRYENSQLKDIFEEEYRDQLYFKDPKIIDMVRKNDLNIHSIFSYCSSCISLLHAKDLLETQDLILFKSFTEKLKYKAEKDNLAAKRIINSEHFKFIESLIEKSLSSELSHPKSSKLISIIEEEIYEYKNKKILIFTQYREMAEILKNYLSHNFSTELNIEKFIGQASKIDDKGFSQKKQIEIIEEFRKGDIDILIATSVAEEGLDIPNVDAIIFYESVPSEIRLIQRRGRAGRSSQGRCYILLTEGTVDISFHKAAENKETIMNSVLSCPETLELNNEITRKKINFSKPQKQYSEFDLILNFRKRRDKEKELLANRSMDEILEELDNFSNSKIKESMEKKGVTFFNDIVELDKKKIKNQILKIKGKKMSKNMDNKKKKRYINNNVKTLVNLAKFYEDDNGIDLSEFQKYASQEDIIEKKFWVHFNRACYLGFLKKEKDRVYLIKHFND